MQLDPTFAGGYIGLANAKFWKYELTRSRFQPDSALLAAAIQDARQPLLLAPSLAEAHGTLSYLLTASGRWDEARAAARRAVTLQPEFSAHHFRLGHATWSDERLRALANCLGMRSAVFFTGPAVSGYARDSRVTGEAPRVRPDRKCGLRNRFPASCPHQSVRLRASVSA